MSVANPNLLRYTCAKIVVGISEQRVLRLTLVLAAIGAVAVMVRYGARDALGFLAGAGLSYLSFRSWVRLAETVGDSGKRPATGSAVFLALRYVLIGVAIYVIIEGLGSTPETLIVGLLVSFVALALQLLWSAVGSK
jgi:small-conductance mechanosensitive channel